jgi:glycosyltransferase involved in cell wall biosynthesis
MQPSDTTRLGMLPKTHGVGGMVTFQAKLEAELSRRGIQVTYAVEAGDLSAVLVVGGTRHLRTLRSLRHQGTPIFQRLDGINWIHRVRKTGLRHFIRAEFANWLLLRIRNRLVDGVIYQSHFVTQWWDSTYGPAPVRHTVVHNGVDLKTYSPEGPQDRPEDRIRILMVEGSLAGGYELGLEHGIRFGEELSERVDQPVELMVVGKADERTRMRADQDSRIPILWEGLVPREEIPLHARSAHLFFAADIHPACPNAVIEALACGLPVVGFDTGALKELVVQGAGVIVPYGGDPWKLETPDFSALAAAAVPIVKVQAAFRRGARAHAEASLGLESMADGYLAAMGIK